MLIGIKDSPRAEMAGIWRVVVGDRVACALAQMLLGLGRRDGQRISADHFGVRAYRYGLRVDRWQMLKEIGPPALVAIAHSSSSDLVLRGLSK